MMLDRPLRRVAVRTRRLSLVLSACALTVAITTAPVHAQKTGASTYRVVPPRGAGVITVGVPVPNGAGGTVTVNIPSANIPVWNPNTETALQAAQRKATALANAVNNYNNWPAGSTPATATPVPIQVPQVQWTQVGNRLVPQIVMVTVGWSIQYSGVTKAVGLVGADPTRQGGGGLNFQPGGGGGAQPTSPGPTYPSYRGSIQNNGSSSDTAQGTDILQYLSNGQPSTAGPIPSVVAMGLFDDSNGSVPNAPIYGAMYFPSLGESESNVLIGLATAFNTENSASGLTASYSSLTDSVSINQPLGFNENLFFADTDPGLSFVGETQLSLSTPAPEANTLPLLMGGVASALACHRRRQRVVRTNLT
jgi:hypothetical protein